MAEHTNPQTPPEAGQEPENTQPQAGGRVFSEEYVSALRNENAGYRSRSKTYESALRTVLGIKAEDELGDVAARVAAYQKDQQTQLSNAQNAANQRLISAEMQKLSGYDHKLLAKLIDLSGVKVDDAGKVTGLEEAAEAVRKEYPAVFKAPPPFGGRTQGATQGADTLKERANAALRAAFGRKD